MRVKKQNVEKGLYSNEKGGRAVARSMVRAVSRSHGRAIPRSRGPAVHGSHGRAVAVKHNFTSLTPSSFS